MYTGVAEYKERGRADGGSHGGYSHTSIHVQFAKVLVSRVACQEGIRRALTR